MTQRKIQYWVIPPQADAEFVAHMEQVLDLYQKPYDPDCPVVCMDEQPVQLVKETRPPMAATKNRPRRVDYEYERAGTAAVFLFSEPLAGWRQATARARRTKVDWALEVAGLLEVGIPEEVEHGIRRKWNSDSGGSGTANPGSGTRNPEEVEHRFRRKWNSGSGGRERSSVA